MGYREFECLKYETEITCIINDTLYLLYSDGNVPESRLSLTLFCSVFFLIYQDFFVSAVGFHYLFYLVLIVFLT